MNVTCVTARYLRYKDPKSYYYTCLLHCLVFKVQEKINLETKMVEMSGIEPLTPCVQGRCSPS